MPDLPTLDGCYTLNPAMGSSLSPIDIEHSGTLGLYLRVNPPDKVAYHAGITCHHVVQRVNSEKDLFAQSLITPLTRNSKCAITCPPTTDHKKLARRYKVQVQDAKVMLGQLEEKEAGVREGIPEFWNDYLAQLKATSEKELTRLRSFLRP